MILLSYKKKKGVERSKKDHLVEDRLKGSGMKCLKVIEDNH
jgi:hypothetical protein